MRIFSQKPFRKRLIAGFIVLLILLNYAAGFFMEPMVTAADVMWQDFRRQKQLDTVYVGSSFCRASFNPYIIDNILGTDSFNMGTSSQTIDESLISVRDAVRTYHVKTVIYGVGFYNFDALTNKNVNAKVGFRRAMEKSMSLPQALRSKWEFVTGRDEFSDPLSVNYFFPWLYNHIDFNDPDAYEDNIEYKLSGKSVLQIAAQKEKFRFYRGKGFLVKDGVIDYSNIEDTGKDLYDNHPDPVTMRKMDELCRYCRENGVSLIVVQTPKTAVDVTSYGEQYMRESRELEQFFAQRGAQYYDFNLIKPSVYQPQPDDFEDFEHLNEKGSSAFSTAFANFLRGHSEDERRNLFWRDWAAYTSSLQQTGTMIYGGRSGDGKVKCIPAR